MTRRTHSDADAARSAPRRGVREVPPPAESGVASWFDADLADAFAVPIDAADVAKGMDSLARSTLGDPAPWIRLLLGLRDGLVARFGVKTTEEVRRAAIADNAERIDFFRILVRSDRELILTVTSTFGFPCCCAPGLTDPATNWLRRPSCAATTRWAACISR
jgi:hypothetical protein